MKLRGLTYTNEGEGGRVLEGKKLRLETHWVHDGKGREDSGHQAESDEAGYQRKAKGVRVSEGEGRDTPGARFRKNGSRDERRGRGGRGHRESSAPRPLASRRALRTAVPADLQRGRGQVRQPAVGSSVQSRVESPVPALVDLCGRKGGCRRSAVGRDNCLSGPVGRYGC
ncbi:PREDICTED: uncharacterized protein LOC105531471 [Mandrillus leucophaeus]|uniref:uncharacterized protein LOC105531471 n=1 Tax=Mandrillus leucophaeus TaxID=9568 RepID=UPI0005F53E5F|nr:PREDICTED: uncharacterized protein LOC105531471 [Mandrillus leucophaeus]